MGLECRLWLYVCGVHRVE